MFKTTLKLKPYFKILPLVAFAIGVNTISPSILAGMSAVTETFWILSLMLGFGWACSEISRGTVFPAFALQSLVSIVLNDALAPLASQKIMMVVCTVIGVFILKCGGDEIQWRGFGKIAGPTILLATVGYMVTFFVTLSLGLVIGIDSKTAALLAAIIGSTDPAALFETLKGVTFKKQHKKLVDISVAESAINDAVGAIFTGAVISMITAGKDVASISNVLVGLAEPHNVLHLAKEVSVGVLAGLVGWLLMLLYEKHKVNNRETSYDFAAVLAVPIFVLLLATFFGGNGFLAAFVVGLLGNYNHGNPNLHKTLGVMEVKIESIGKPLTFMMAGPLVSVDDLWDNATMGAVISLLFILVVRPVAVFISLLFPILRKKITVQEALFLCAVRETGVIPIVLTVGAVALFPELKALMPLVAWVVIWTLVVLPAITPWWARTLGLTEQKK